MSITTFDRILFAVRRFYNRTIRKVIHLDMYGISLCGIQITPKSVAHSLMRNGDFSPNQRRHHDIRLIANSFYVFLPKRN
jgi:hypothetical protein